ncbi:hypothetical protein [Corynebacterium amycolatum]|nr:hypothetical protein [Corynebacterium amycolatum]EEB62844.1 hypothetical protein CORAM0001_1166 [Corynebacterium amycolatum SK46]
MRLPSKPEAAKMYLAAERGKKLDKDSKRVEPTSLLATAGL